MSCGIYGIKNLANNKWYIGQSVDIYGRKGNHFSSLKRGCHYNVHLQHAFKKFGLDNFRFCILEEAPASFLDIKERHWIARYKSNQKDFGYNMDNGGSLNKIYSEESRKKISISHMGIGKGMIRPPISEQHRKNLSLAAMGNTKNKGHHHSAETRLKISESHRGEKSVNYGKHLSKTTRLKISKANKGKKGFWLGKHHSLETRQKMSRSHTAATIGLNGGDSDETS